MVKKKLIEERRATLSVWVIVLVAAFLLVGGVFLISTNNAEPVPYNQLEDDLSINSKINSYMDGKDLVIEYSTDDEKVWIEGLAVKQFLIKKDRVIVYDYNDEEFRLHIGEESDIYKFGYKQILKGDTTIRSINNNKTVIIYSDFNSKDISRMDLITPSNNIIYCEGYCPVARFTINSTEDFLNAINKFEFYKNDKFGEKIGESEFDLKYLTYENKEVLKYNTLSNGSNYEENGTEIKKIKQWVNLTDPKIDKGVTEIQLYYNNVEGGVTVEWIPTFFEIRNEYWASFTGAALVESYTTGDDTEHGLWAVSDNIAQTFTVGNTGYNIDFNLSGINLKLFRVGSPGNVGINITPVNSSGHPIISVVYSTGTIDGATLTTTSSGVWYNISMSSYKLEASTKYAIHLYPLGTIGGSDRFHWRADDSSSTYSGGQAFSSSDSGGTWTGHGDHMFEVWGISAFPNATITYPVNGTTYNTSITHFNWSITNNTPLDTCLYSINGTTNVSVTCTDGYKAISIADGDYNILFTLNDSLGQMNWTQNYFTVDTTPPVINVTYPYETITNQTVGHTLNFNWTASDATSSVSSCWFNYNNTNTTVTCGDENTTFVTDLTGQRNLTFYANDTLNNVANFTRYWDYKFLEKSRTFNATGYETGTDTFILNISSDGTETVTAEFWHNQTLYTATKTGSNTEMIFTSTVGHPWGMSGNKTFYWVINHGATTINSTPDSQIIERLIFGYCNATLTTPFINFTFKDEVTSTYINSTFDVTDWFYYTGDGSQNKTFSYTNTTENPSYAFCFNLNLTVHNNASIKYKGASYPQRIYAQSVDLSNETTNKILYLLGTANGQYVAFKTQDKNAQVIAGATITIEKEVEGAWTSIAEDLTDSAGIATFFLNPDYNHRITASRDDYTTYISIIRPTQSSYTIVLSGGETTTTSFRWEGINYDTYPRTGTILAPNTTYTFGFNITSSIGNITDCKIEITNISFDVIGSATGCGAYGGNISVALGTDDHRKLFGNYYVNFGEGYALLKSNDVWMVEMVNISSAGGSVWEWMTDFADYEGWGEGNKAEYSKITFFFIILVFLLGLFTKYTGVEITTPGYTMLVLSGVIILFSITGLFTIEGIIPNAWLAKYYIAIMTSMLTGGYILNYWRRNTT